MHCYSYNLLLRTGKLYKLTWKNSCNWFCKKISPLTINYFVSKLNLCICYNDNVYINFRVIKTQKVLTRNNVQNLTKKVSTLVVVTNHLEFMAFTSFDWRRSEKVTINSKISKSRKYISWNVYAKGKCFRQKTFYYMVHHVRFFPVRRVSERVWVFR